MCCLSSCEKDFIHDTDCVARTGSNEVPSWDSGSDTTVVHKPDTIQGGFDITVDQWGDTIVTNIHL